MPTAKFLDGLILIQFNGKTDTCFEHWNRELPRWKKSLRTWGKERVVKSKIKFTPKLEICGEFCMFVDYAEIHNYGVY